MFHQVLDKLLNDDLWLRCGATSSALAVHRLLQSSEEVASVRNALANGEITEATINGFVRELLKEFKPGELFVHEVALTALAVVLETRATSLAREYVESLAKLNALEMPIATRVAKECARIQRGKSASKQRIFTIRDNGDSASEWQQISPMPRVSIGQTTTDFEIPTASTFVVA